MANNRPSYDDLLKSSTDARAFYLMVNSVVCLIGWFLYSFFITIVFVYASVSAGYSDTYGIVMYSLAYLFVLFYGIWHMITRMYDIWTDELREWFIVVALFVVKLCRAISKGYHSLSEESKSKKVQTELPTEK